MNVKCIVVGEMQVNCYLYIEEKSKQVVIIDPGEDAAKIIRYIDSNGLKPVSILLTHAHLDHIGALLDLKEKYNLKVVIHEKEDEILADAEKNGSIRYYIFPIEIHADILLKGGEFYDPFGGIAPLKVLHTPGHSRGSICLYNEDMKIVFSGDTLFKLSIGATQYYSGSMNEEINSIKQKLFTLPDDTNVLSGHGLPTQIGFEKKSNPFFN